MRPQNNSGIILIVLLWILVILSMLAIGLGRRAGVDLALTKHAIGKVKAQYAAMAGLHYAMDQIQQDKKDKESGKFDSRYQCGFRLEGEQAPEDLFKHIKVGEGYFDISYFHKDPASGRMLRYGFQDEESKININTLTYTNYNILRHLITQFGHDDEAAETIASSAVDWRDENDDIFNEPYGAEEDYYAAQDFPTICKNQPFESIEELMLVKGMTSEIFQDIKGMISVSPAQGRFLVNIDTASAPVLRAMARNFAGAKTNAGIDDADSLVGKILSYRAGDDGIEATEDDPSVDENEMGLNVKERIIFVLMKQNQTKVSHYLRVQIKGVDEQSHVPSYINAVVYRDDLSITYWHRR